MSAKRYVPSLPSANLPPVLEELVYQYEPASHFKLRQNKEFVPDIKSYEDFKRVVDDLLESKDVDDEQIADILRKYPKGAKSYDKLFPLKERLFKKYALEDYDKFVKDPLAKVYSVEQIKRILRDMEQSGELEDLLNSVIRAGHDISPNLDPIYHYITLQTTVVQDIYGRFDNPTKWKMGPMIND